MSFDDTLEAELNEVSRELAKYKHLVEVLAAERDHARAHYDATFKILMGIHNLLYPPTFKFGDETFGFKSPYVHEQMQALSDAIRKIPEQLEELKKPVWSSYGGGPIADELNKVGQ